MKNKQNKAPEFFCAATSFLIGSALHAIGIPPISITLSSGENTNKVNIRQYQIATVEYKIQDIIGRPPSRTWLWSPPTLPYLTRIQSLHQPDCAIYNQANSNPNAFTLPPNAFCYFAVQVDGTQLTKASPGNTVRYRPMFSNSSAAAYGPCESEQLYISLIPTILPLIAAGLYCDANNTQRPFLALSQDASNTWNYPESITDPNFTTQPPILRSGFYSSSCIGNLCIAVGDYSYSGTYPLLALSQDSGNTWNYPESITTPIFNINPLNHAGSLLSASCSEKVCIAAGFYFSDNNTTSRPLLALSQDFGNTWSYPESITTPVFHSNPFNNYSSLNGTSCNGNTCIAVGNYGDTNDIQRPLLALSQNAGTSWNYPESITTPVFTDPVITAPSFANYGAFSSASCNGSTCIAVGSYEDTNNIQHPLLALNQSPSSVWIYPGSITTPVFNTYPFADLGTFNSASCNASTCIAVGYYADTSNIQRPLLAISHNSGNTWEYPESIITPTFINYPFKDIGKFISANCKGSVCIAVGSYEDISNTERPLLVVSRDSGQNWSYSQSIPNPTLTTYPFSTGALLSISCNESTCFAAGQYIDTNLIVHPLLATSKDSGLTWNYSDSITNVIFTPQNTNPFVTGMFYAATASSESFLPKSLRFIVRNQQVRQPRGSISTHILDCGIT